jgi:hypothetical protein
MLDLIEIVLNNMQHKSLRIDGDVASGKER